MNHNVTFEQIQSAMISLNDVCNNTDESVVSFDKENVDYYTDQISFMFEDLSEDECLEFANKLCSIS